MNDPIDLCIPERVLVNDTSRTLADMGININDQLHGLSLQNVGDTTLYLGWSEVDSGTPTAGSPSVPRSAALLAGDSVDLTVNSHNIKRVKFKTRSGTTEMNVLQKGALPNPRE